MSIGELFVQLGVVGDAKEVDEVIQKAQKQLELTKQQIKANEKLKEAGKKFEKAFNFDKIRKLFNKFKEGFKEFGKNFEKAFSFDKIRKQFSKFQEGFNISKGGGKGIGGIINMLSRSFKGLGLACTSTAGAIGFVIGAIVAVGIAVVKAYQAIDKLTESLVRDNQQWVNFIHQTDMAFDKLQGYSGVAGLLDKSLGMEGAAGSIKQLNDRLFELRLTGQGSQGFLMAGITSTGQDALATLDILRERIKQIKGETARSWMLQQIGLDPRILPMLEMERSEFEKLRKTIEAYSLTAEQRLQIQQYNIQLELARYKMQYIKDRIILAIMPHFVRLTKNIAFIVDGVAKFVKLIHDARKNLNNINTGLGKTLFFFQRIMDIFNALSFLNPFKWLYEIIDDVSGYFNGEKSVIGAFFYQLDRIKDSFSMDNIFGNMQAPAWLTQLSDAANKLYSVFASGKNPLQILASGTNPLSPAPVLNALNPQNIANEILKYVNDNRTVNQQVSIYTPQAADEVDNQLRFAMGSIPAIT